MVNRTLTFAIQFAGFAKELNISPYDLADMITLAKQRATAYRQAMKSTPKIEQLEERLETLAKLYELGVHWPGNWPIITNKGQQHSLPCD
jgi:hypothetical protein